MSNDLAPAAPESVVLTEVFMAAVATESGISRWALARLVKEGAVRRVLRDVYARADVPDSLDVRARAAALVLPPHAIVVDRSAAWLWGVDALRPAEVADPPRLEVFVLRGHKRVTRSELRGGERDLLPHDVVTVGCVRVTTPLRTALDLACRPGRYEALAAMDGLARSHGVTARLLTEELPRFRRRRGVVQARALVPLVDGRSESAGESFTRLAIHDSGLPPPTLQHWVVEGGRAVFRLDLAYPGLRICVEYDGVAHHSAPEDRRADQRRRTWLESRGWVVIVVDKDSFRGEALDRWLHELRRLIRLRAQ
jgi:hypothetical protein